MKKFFTLLLLCLMYMPIWAEESDYTRGVFFLNEDWYGHSNGSINYLRSDGEWDYRIFQKENPGKQLGATSQYAVVFDGKLFIISKQEKDPSVSVSGGRITVCDAKTMKCLKQIENIAIDKNGVSIADGRAFVGVDQSKGYISTSNGIYIFDIDNLCVEEMIPETGNDGASLYSAQCGNMVCVDDMVYAVHQKKGLLIINATTDTIVKIVKAPVDIIAGKEYTRGFGSIVRSKDGNLWLSVAANQSGDGSSVDYLIKYDVVKSDTVRVLLPEGYGVPNSWYAWCADGFCSSSVENKIYWKNNGGWFASTKIYYYDIDKNETKELFDTKSIEWNIYGAGFRIHPETDDIYCMLYQDFRSQSYLTVKISSRGELLERYEMIDYYWFPSLPVFPEKSEDDGSVGNSVNEMQNIKMEVYPNPVSSTLFVNMPYASKVYIYTITGNLVETFDFHIGDNMIDISNYVDGVYIMKSDFDTKKIIVK